MIIVSFVTKVQRWKQLALFNQTIEFVLFFGKNNPVDFSVKVMNNVFEKSCCWNATNIFIQTISS